MDSDSQTANNSSQSGYLDEQTDPLFTVGRELATLITSCGILHTAWKRIKSVSENDVDFFLNEDGVAYVTFPSFSGEDFRYGEYNIQNERIFSVCLKGTDEKPAIVHKGAFNRFLRILESTDFKAKMKDLKAQTIIFVGHSMGGAVATLATLWFLQKKERYMSYFCITFGSPLVGNAILGEAIGREDWTGKFCNVVSKYDIVPRMLLAPFESIAEPLNAIVPHWRSTMGTDYVAVTHLYIRKACKTLLENVRQCTSTIAGNCQGGSGLRSPYRPFGTYMFCSTQGAACIDDSDAVLKMLHLTMQGMSFDQLADTCTSDHTGYGQMLEAMTKDLLNATPIANSATGSFEMGIVLELEAMAVGAQNTSASCALRTAGELKNKQDMNIEKLNRDLGIVQSSLAEVEWYKTRCKDSGYYDSFKEVCYKRDFHVNLHRKKLETFWMDIVKMEEKHVLPSDFRCQNKWINAGTAYRRLVEPLDIPEYYRRQKDSKDFNSYLSDEVRPRHYRVLEKWMEEKEKTRTGKKKERTKFASLTLDSCFWARVEDACQALTNLQQGALKESREFEQYILERIREKSISVEVFLQDSSFMIWWEQYNNYLQLQSSQLMSKSRLFPFMAKEGWK